MKMLTRLALVGCLVSVGIHLYLTTHYYPIKFGLADGPSVCNLGGKFNCDAVAASQHSSVLGVPLAVLGMVSNFILFFMLLLAWLGWTDNPERLRRWATTLAGGSLTASVIMGLISLKMGNYCLFCVVLYALSLLIFECARRSLEEPYFLHIKRDLPNMWAESQSILWAFLSIPILAYLIHTGFLQNFGAGQLDQVIGASVRDWINNPVKPLSTKPLLTMGPERAKATLTISEFADFRCHHCKTAGQSLHAFVQSHSDVRLEYFAFPLDGDCSSPEKTNISCNLAFAVYCAEQQSKGWEMHDAVYEAQAKTLTFSTVSELKEFMPELYTQLSLDKDKFENCITSPEAKDAIQSQSKQGAIIDIRGTPTIFGDEKLLPRGQLIPVLEGARASKLSTSN